VCRGAAAAAFAKLAASKSKITSVSTIIDDDMDEEEEEEEEEEETVLNASREMTSTATTSQDLTSSISHKLHHSPLLSEEKAQNENKKKIVDHDNDDDEDSIDGHVEKVNDDINAVTLLDIGTKSDNDTQSLRCQREKERAIEVALRKQAHMEAAESAAAMRTSFASSASLSVFSPSPPLYRNTKSNKSTTQSTRSTSMKTKTNDYKQDEEERKVINDTVIDINNDKEYHDHIVDECVEIETGQLVLELFYWPSPKISSRSTAPHEPRIKKKKTRNNEVKDSKNIINIKEYKE